MIIPFLFFKGKTHVYLPQMLIINNKKRVPHLLIVCLVNQQPKHCL